MNVKFRKLVAIILFATISAFSMAAMAVDTGAFNVPPGCDAPIHAIEPLPNGDVVLGGNFTTCGGVTVNHVALYDGTNYYPLGSGVDNNVFALELAGNTLYVGGMFHYASGVEAFHIASWSLTSSTWNPVGSGVIPSFPVSEVYALAWDNGVLYAGGMFLWMDGVSANYIAKWNGTAWSPLGSGSLNGVNHYVIRLLAYNGSIYAGGLFTAAWTPTAAYGWGSALPVGYVARWNGGAWDAMGGGVDSYVYALAATDNAVYVGGFFDNAGYPFVAAHRVASYDGISWSAMGGGLDGYVFALLAIDDSSGADRVYAGGQFPYGDGGVKNGIARYKAAPWERLESSGSIGVGGHVYALALSKAVLGVQQVAVGGNFASAGGTPLGYFTEWAPFTP